MTRFAKLLESLEIEPVPGFDQRQLQAGLVI